METGEGEPISLFLMIIAGSLVQWNQAFHVSYLVNYSLFAPYRKGEEVGNKLGDIQQWRRQFGPNYSFLKPGSAEASPFVEGSPRRLIDRDRTVLEPYFTDIPNEQAV
jgi:hypothetical protein